VASSTSTVGFKNNDNVATFIIQLKVPLRLAGSI
jgi:hypothetical protein